MTKKLDKGATTTPLRPRDLLVVKVVDWSDDGPDNCQAYDVETYVNGKFVNDRSEVFEFGREVNRSKEQARATAFARAREEVARSA